MSTVSEVYARNIMPWSVCNFFGIRENDEDSIKEILEEFKNFLIGFEKVGTIFSSQVLGWEAFTEYMMIYGRPDDFIHLNTDAGESEDLHWRDEILNRAYELANLRNNLANYDDRKAQN